MVFFFNQQGRISFQHLHVRNRIGKPKRTFARKITSRKTKKEIEKEEWGRQGELGKSQFTWSATTT